MTIEGQNDQGWSQQETPAKESTGPPLEEIRQYLLDRVHRYPGETTSRGLSLALSVE